MEQLVNFVIRPPRSEYNPSRDLLSEEFTVKNRQYRREDLKIKNKYGHTLECSHYMPKQMKEEQALPCVIYCHGNSGCRGDASEAAVILLPSNITVFSLDFSGSGLSEGEYVTLGWNEKDDLKAVVEHLRTDKRISCIGLWGRSMGAVTCLLYGAEDPSIAGMVLDSPFSNLVDLMMELVDVYKVRLPKFTLKVAIQYMRKIIQKKARFDIMDLDTIQIAKKSFIPALFGHASDDSFIQPHHSDRIYEAYAGDKNIIKFEGDHNSPRPRFYYDSINIFFHNVLSPPELPVAEFAPGSYYDEDDLDINDESIWMQVFKAMQPPSISSSAFRLDNPADNDASSSPVWHMSRTEVPQDIGNLQDDMSKLMLDTELDGVGSANSLMHSSNGVSSFGRHTGAENYDDDVWPDFIPEDSSTSSRDRFADFPITPEDEDMMVMKAIALSLQDTGGSNEEGSSSQVPGKQTEQPNASIDVGSTQQVAQSKETSTTQAMGTLEALGQKWGLGLFRATSTKQDKP